VYERRLPEDDIYLTFRYRVVRVWEQPVDALLSGPVTTLPLAALVGLSETNTKEVLRRIETRVRDEADSTTAERVRAGTYLLLGLRFPQDVIDGLLQGVGIMAGALKESSTYQGILREGREEALAPVREMLLRIGTRQFGPPDEATRTAVGRLTDPKQLVRLTEQVLDATSWDDLGIDKPAQ
jgi:hypothetical protein